MRPIFVFGMDFLGFNPIHDYPSWFFLLCLATGLIYAGLLYYRNHREGFSRMSLWIFAALRFLAVSLLSFLLLAPLIERLSRHVEEPILIFVQDNSRSVVLHPDGFDAAGYLQGKDRFLEALETKFQILEYTFGESFNPADSISFDEKLTDISEVFSGIGSGYSNRNIGAVVLASDGIVNRGVNPLFLGSGLTYPVYTMALGDTLPRRDLLVGRINHNRMTYLGNDFPVEVFVEARQAENLSSQLTITRDGETVFSRDLQFSDGLHQETILAELSADRPGMQRYRVNLATVAGEVTLVNNSRDFYIEVIDGRQQVLILAHAPHPDVGALKLSLEESENYEVTAMMFSEFEGGLQAYNLLVLHQLPGQNHRMDDFFERVAAADLPVLFVLGQQSDFRTFNSLGTGVNIQTRSDAFTETLPSLNPSFSLFGVPETTTGMLPNLPPLYSPFANYELAGGARVLLFQKIGQVVSDQPLAFFSGPAGPKTGVITGEGLWRWRLATYSRMGSHTAFDELIYRMVQYLSVREDRSRFRVRAEEFLFENEEVVVEAELYNPSFELVNEPEVSLVIVNGEGLRFPYQMGRTSKAYRLSAGRFPPGDYNHQATTSFGGETFTAEGKFTVSPLNLEGVQTIADHNLLYQLAEQSGGEMFYPDQWERLREHLLNRDDMNPVLYTRKTFDEMINLKGIFFVLLILLAAEWFMRKRGGSY